MAAKRSRARHSTSAGKTTRKRTSGLSVQDSLNRLERELPSNLGQLMRQVRSGLRDVERQLERARTDGERRWNRLETQVRRDAARLLRRLEKAIEPPKPTRRKANRKKTASRAATGDAAVRREPAAPSPGESGAASDRPIV